MFSVMPKLQSLVSEIIFLRELLVSTDYINSALHIYICFIYVYICMYKWGAQLCRCQGAGEMVTTSISRDSFQLLESLLSNYSNLKFTQWNQNLSTCFCRLLPTFLQTSPNYLGLYLLINVFPSSFGWLNVWLDFGTTDFRSLIFWVVPLFYMKFVVIW